VVDRGIALVKMIRLATIATAGNGYLNFMGNEFGHPEWIDFPREGNNWSHFYCRRQWSLAENGFLRYQFLQKFDREMIHLVDENKIFNNKPVSLYQDELQKLLIFERGCLIFAFNFHPSQSVTNFRFSAPKGKYRLILDTDGLDYNGFGRNDASVTHSTIEEYGDSKLSLYLPNRSAIVLKKIK
jgi:1,4-alpha-glucan branching enzyme